MPNINDKILKTDYDTVINSINSARTKWGLATFAVPTELAVDKIILASTLATLKTRITEAKTKSGSTTDLSVLTMNQNEYIKATDMSNMVAKSNEIYNYCACNCNYACTCNCQYSCTCNCQYSCTCNCQYCTCNCQYCTCNCNYSCTCNCNYSCTCNCNDCSCYCSRPGSIMD